MARIGPSRVDAVMLVFLDFEASSLSKQSYPIEVAWVFEDGRSESHLIRPAPSWDDWDAAAEAVHRIARAELLEHGDDHATVARRMVDQLSGHDLLASAPSWDGKWLSVLLRAAKLPRHSLRLRDSDDAHRERAHAILSRTLSNNALASAVADVLEQSEPRRAGEPPAHRALADAAEEHARWIAIGQLAETRAGGIPA
jgi:hypothetical protein